MRKFTKEEFIVVSLMLLLIFVGTGINLEKAMMRARDAERKVDLGIIANNLNDFQTDYGFFPKSDMGKIVICKNEKFSEALAELRQQEQRDFSILDKGLKTCKWGKDPFADVLGGEGAKDYMDFLPSDPRTKDGYSYYYVSNGARYQIFAYLEGEESESGYNQDVVDRGLPCGKGICSFGRAYGSAPVDITIEEYEKQLLDEQSKSGK